MSTNTISLDRCRAMKQQVVKEMQRLNADDKSIKKAVAKALRLYMAGHGIFYAIKMATREHAFAFIGTRGPGAA